MQYNNKNLLRIVPVIHSKDFELECNQFYTGIDTTQYVIFHNAGKWYDRILSDLEYKTFKHVDFTKLFKNVWEVSFKKLNNDIQDDYCKNITYFTWFYNNIEPYIYMKLNTYNEDNEHEDTLMETVSNYMQNIKLYAKDIKMTSYFEKWVDVEGDYLVLKNPEKNKHGKYVLSIHEISALLYNLVYYFIDYFVSFEHLVPNDKKDTSSIGDISTIKNDIEFDVCEFTRNISLNTTRIHKDKIMEFLKKQFNISIIELMKLRDTPSFQTYARLDEVKAWFSYDKSNKQYWKGTPQSLYDDYNDSIFCPIEFDEYNVQIIEKDTNKEKMEAKEVNNNSSQIPSLLYRNAISNEVKRCSSTVQYLSEFIYIGEINTKTDIGNYVADMIPHISNLNIQDIIQDMRYILKLLSSLYSDTIYEKDELDVCGDIQKIYTKKYVNKFKNDTKETSAAMTIDNLFGYISRFIEPKDINMNKLGQDLVDLGVKKTRKARGFVYGLEYPSQQRLEEFIMEDSVNSYSAFNSNDVNTIQKTQKELQNLTSESKQYRENAMSSMSTFNKWLRNSIVL